ncbi:MAG: radical SAM protein [Deltaproteobacteria bacterium]|nr:radical SAM protein [Myxococcales bacterium]MDP3214148.1 radical SAM protein [Deltaproteobacteria bacterium]
MQPSDDDAALVEVPAALASMRRFALDDALLLFDRRTGLTAVCDGPETVGLRMRVPRVVQFAITNACNLACAFCSRDASAASAWSADGAFALLSELSARGVLEVAFGGGEPLAFKGFASLVRRLHDETGLAVSLTTNGTLLTDAVLRELAPCVAQLRLSVYDDVEHRPLLARLAASGLRFGVNWLVTPARLASVEAVALDLVHRGCRDLLLLSYNGRDPAMHLSRAQSDALAARVALLSRALGGRGRVKLDVCWGERMEAVPQLFGTRPCAAGREFVVLTSDRRMSACSFHHRSFAVASADDVLRVWRDERDALASPAEQPGCARAAGFGLDGTANPRALPVL